MLVYIFRSSRDARLVPGFSIFSKGHAEISAELEAYGDGTQILRVRFCVPSEILLYGLALECAFLEHYYSTSPPVCQYKRGFLL